MALPAPTKRHFIPTFDSFVADFKKRKLNSKQSQNILPTFPKEKPAEFDREKLSSEQRELVEIMNRPKFQAIPLPKSLYCTPSVPVQVNAHMALRQKKGTEEAKGGGEKRRVCVKKAGTGMEGDTGGGEGVARGLENRVISGHISHPTVPEPFQLHSSQRSEERQAFEAQIRRKNEQRARTAELELIEKQKREMEEIRKIRENTVFKAKPIFKTAVFAPSKSTKPLTRPESPHLSSSQRSLQDFNPSFSASQQSSNSFLSQEMSFFKD